MCSTAKSGSDPNPLAEIDDDASPQIPQGSLLGVIRFAGPARIAAAIAEGELHSAL